MNYNECCVLITHDSCACLQNERGLWWCTFCFPIQKQSTREPDVSTTLDLSKLFIQSQHVTYSISHILAVQPVLALQNLKLENNVWMFLVTSGCRLAMEFHYTYTQNVVFWTVDWTSTLKAKPGVFVCHWHFPLLSNTSHQWQMSEQTKRVQRLHRPKLIGHFVFIGKSNYVLHIKEGTAISPYTDLLKTKLNLMKLKYNLVGCDWDFFCTSKLSLFCL